MLRYGDYLPVKVTAPMLAKAPFCAANLVNDYGLDQPQNPCALHDNHEHGNTMWLLEAPRESFQIVFDLEGFLPVGAMRVWNYNRPGQTDCGLNAVALFTSVDGIDWQKAADVSLRRASGEANLAATDLADGGAFDFGGVTARYIKLAVDVKSGAGNHGGAGYGLSKVMFFAGEGYAVERDAAWTAMLAEQYEGWTGSDGVFTIPMNGSELYAPGVDTTITFGDSLLDSVDRKTMRRSDKLHMIHNSACFLKGSRPEPENARFQWGRASDGGAESLLKPDISVQNDQSQPAYYWPQDSVLIGDACYTFPFTVMDYPEGPEGFQFKVDGVAMVVSPKEGGRIAFDKARHYKANLYAQIEGGSIAYGACTFANTRSAGAPNPDGYVYLCGGINRNSCVSLCLARTREADIADGSCWTFYDGAAWSADIRGSAPLVPGVSCELSLSAVTGRLNSGAYLLIYQENVNSHILCYRTAPAPWGPYSQAKRIFCTDEVFAGRGVYTYNAKGHPHLSPPGELLMSYNVNTIAWDMHMAHADICRPRFIRMTEIVK